MGFWMLLLIASLGAFFGNLFFNLSFQNIIKKLWGKTFNLRHPLKSKRKRMEIENIKSMALFLALVGPLPYNPGELTTHAIRDFLLDMRSKAEKIKSKELRGIRKRLISFSNIETNIEENMDLMQVQSILGRENAYRLSEEIWQAIKSLERKK